MLDKLESWEPRRSKRDQAARELIYIPFFPFDESIDAGRKNPKASAANPQIIALVILSHAMHAFTVVTPVLLISLKRRRARCTISVSPGIHVDYRRCCSLTRSRSSLDPPSPCQQGGVEEFGVAEERRSGAGTRASVFVPTASCRAADKSPEHPPPPPKPRHWSDAHCTSYHRHPVCRCRGPSRLMVPDRK